MSRTYQQSEDIVSEVLDGEAVLLHMATGKYFAMNATATRMWQLLVQLRDFERTIERLRVEYEVPEADLRRDLETLVASLVDRGLLSEHQ